MLQYKTNGDLIRLHYIPSFCLQIPQGETVNSFQMFAYVLDCISMLFQQHIPKIGARTLTIVNSPDSESPICLRDISMIRLNTAPSRWAQIAYQYAHELCHYSIPNDVPNNLRWLEESICEMASLYFLRQIGELWYNGKKNFITVSGKPYALEFIRYAADTANNFEAFDLKDPSIIHDLESNCYNRLRNRYVANQLLSVFIEYPNTWAAVPSLCQVAQPTLAKALDAWIRESPPQAWLGLQQIRNLF